MAEHSTIEWTDATWNPITGCTVCSPGCANCYAMKLAGTRLKNHPTRIGLTKPSKAGPVWTGEVRFNEKALLDPLKWKRHRMIFVCAHGDLFHESVPDAWIDKVFAVMALCPQHTFQVLTKRSARMLAYFVGHHTPRTDGSIQVFSALQRVQGIVADYVRLGHFQPSGFGPVFKTDWDRARDKLRPFPLPNVWLGVSAERQQEADVRIPDLLATPAAVRFVSLEPLLGQIDLQTDLRRYLDHGLSMRPGAIDWVIVGGESQAGARPMHFQWVRSLRDQCSAAGVPFFFKQWGDWKPICYMTDAEHEGLYRSNREAKDGERQEIIDELYGRTCKVPLGVIRYDGRFFTDDTFEGFRQIDGHGGMTMFRVGKKAAGRLLDGVEHNGMPTADVDIAAQRETVSA